MNVGFSGGVPSIGHAITFGSASIGKITAPVARTQVIYSNFENVQGVAAPEGSNGVSVSKLKILDTLIEQLKQSRSSAVTQALPDKERVTGLTDEQADVLIEQYETKIHQMTSAAQASANIASAYTMPEAPVGAAFSLLA
jgi:hypothetical protein